MSDRISEKISAMLAIEKKRSRRRQSLVLAGIAVVLATAYALVQPAASLSGTAYCGLTDHEHDESCYSQTLTCTFPEESLVDDSDETTVTHVHSDDCYLVEEILLCTLPDGSVVEDANAVLSDSNDSFVEEPGDQLEPVAHTHSEACYEKVTTLICDIPEVLDSQLDPEPDKEAHSHSDSCYESTLICGVEEHSHGLQCYSNPNADLETSSDWEASLPADDRLTGNWADDVLAVAASQLGYEESGENYAVTDDGRTKGYTRYGDWYGDAYGDWCAMFVSFCLHYAGIPSEAIPQESNCQSWIEKLADENTNLWRSASDAEYADVYVPDLGDLVFFDWGEDGTSDHVGLVYELIESTETEPAKVKTIEGNASDAVRHRTYDLHDKSIMGYADLPEKPEEDAPKPEDGSSADGGSSEPAAPFIEATEYDFSFENDDLALTLHVAGIPELEAADGASASDETLALSWDQATLAVSQLPENSTEYRVFATCMADDEGTGDLLDLSVFEYELRIGDERLDLSRCEISVEIAPKESLTVLPEEHAATTPDEGGAIAPEAEVGVVLTAMQEGAIAPEIGAEAALMAIQGDDRTQASLSERGERVNGDEILLLSETTDLAIPEGESQGASALDQQMRSVAAFVPQGSQESPVLAMTLSYGEPFALAASEVANPRFQVQYYAYLERAAASGATALDVIDTSNGGNGEGGVLPTNGSVPKTKSIFLEDADNGKKRVATASVLTEVYAPKDCEYIYSPSLSYFNRLYENGNYALSQIWVLKAGKDASSVNEGDWDVYDDPSVVHFTNRAASVKDEPGNKTLLISDDAVIRLVFDTSRSFYTNAATFHDYDITNGFLYTDSAFGGTTSSQSGTVYASTNQQGINYEYNYGAQTGAKLAFGNQNTASGLADVEWSGNYLNKYNATGSGDSRVERGYKGCTFGLASGIGGDGGVVFSGGIAAANIFGTKTAAGKTSYDGYSLLFNRVGDTYTLSSVNGTEATGLQYFNNPESDKLHTSIWTNNFWPMDSAPSFGASGHDLKFGSYDLRANRKYSGAEGAVNNFPYSDDGLDHNSYFGMQYAVNFVLSEDYCGPMEYYFFGDDDMWVFLSSPDGTTDLVCDIGGVHSSVGEYVDLWDYIGKGDSGTYTLSFFYTERGASGSTCYMQFTLPSVSSVTPEQNTGMLTVEKQVTGDGRADLDQEFEFEIRLTDGQGNHLPDDYAYVRYAEDGSVVERDVIVYDGGEFRLRHGERVVIGYLPKGTCYEITEKQVSGFLAHNKVGQGALVTSNTATGSIDAATYYSVVYENQARYELPSTGGMGTTWHAMGGVVLLTAAFFAYKGILRRKGDERGL